MTAGDLARRFSTCGARGWGLYAENGYLVMEEFLNPREPGEWRIAVDRALRQRGRATLLVHHCPRKRGCASPGTKQQDDYYNRGFVQRVNLWPC
jgi:hypothetical protein